MFYMWNFKEINNGYVEIGNCDFKDNSIYINTTDNKLIYILQLKDNRYAHNLYKRDNKLRFYSYLARKVYSRLGERKIVFCARKESLINE